MSSAATPVEQRIGNVPPAAWTPEVQNLFPIMLPSGSAAKGSDFNSILILAQHPRLSEPWLRFNAKVAQGFTLSARHREIAILRVAWRRGSEYEWAHHMLSGSRAGLTIADFQALQKDDPGSEWSELERALIQSTDEICLLGGIEPDTLGSLQQHFSTEQTMELLYAVGCYIALAAILNTAAAAIEPAIAHQVATSGFPVLSRAALRLDDA
jgi:alkylhydroperoxidase family enzyme